MLAQKPLTLHAGTWLQRPRELAPLRLTDMNGRKFTSSDLVGHPSLVFFGFTHCPDICPTTLATINVALEQATVTGLRALFITVDPERDQPHVLKAYLHQYNDAIVGLEGEPSALATLLRSFSASSAARPRANGFDHSATVYLLDSKGRLVAVFTPPLSAQGLSSDLRALAAASKL